MAPSPYETPEAVQGGTVRHTTDSTWVQYSGNDADLADESTPGGDAESALKVSNYAPQLGGRPIHLLKDGREQM